MIDKTANVSSIKSVSLQSSKMSVRWAIVCGLFGITCFGIAFDFWRVNHWKRFGVVDAGQVYRSGKLNPRQLDKAIVKLRLATVVCLNPDSAESDERVCRDRGIEFHAFGMPADGLGDIDAFANAMEILKSHDRQPVLIHCQAGVARTGACVALHRVLHEDWAVESALDEMRSFERKGRIEPKLREHIETMASKLATVR